MAVEYASSLTAQSESTNTIDSEPVVEFEREIDKHWKLMETPEGKADFINWTKLLQLADKLSVCWWCDSMLT